MCGITGFIDFTLNMNNHELSRTIAPMVKALRHRGPDDNGSWVDQKAGLALGHTRLSIIDLSHTGHQPMTSHCGRYVIVYNGEIYNFLEIREHIEKRDPSVSWVGHSDTEVILKTIAIYGLEEALKKFNGMFAFALWDKKEQSLSLARDRLGEKPLYFGWQGDCFLFGSELKSLKFHPAWQAKINRDAIAQQFRYSYITAPNSIYENIFKLEPGKYMNLRVEDLKGLRSYQDLRSAICPYWSIGETYENNGQILSDEDHVCELENLLSDAVSKRMISDVPLGAFLSGGYDSSTIVALMQKHSTSPVKTFSIGFSEDAYNEAEHAKNVAGHLGTDHEELYVSEREAQDVIPKLTSMYDEPFSDSSQIPTYLVSQMTKRKVTVALSGDGGDELLYGYRRYKHAEDTWRQVSKTPRFLRYPVSKSLSYVGSVMALGKQKKAYTAPNKRELVMKASEAYGVKSFSELYEKIKSHWHNSTDIVLSSKELPIDRLQDTNTQFSSVQDEMMFNDIQTYLPDDILTKVDRASMAVSLETRIPLLDHRVVDRLWHMPIDVKYRENQMKWPLRQILYKYVPQPLVDRPKMGFGIPIGIWLRSSLRDWAEDLLDEKKMLQDGFLDPIPIQEMWQSHLAGDRNWQGCLWDVLMFQAWLRDQ